MAQNEQGARFFLLADAEGGKDQIEDVVAGGLAGEGVEGPEGAVEVDQDHLMRNVAGVCLGRIGESGACRGNGLLVAQAGEQAGFSGGSAGGEGENSFAKSRNALAG